MPILSLPQIPEEKKSPPSTDEPSLEEVSRARAAETRPTEESLETVVAREPAREEPSTTQREDGPGKLEYTPPTKSGPLTTFYKSQQQDLAPAPPPPESEAARQRSLTKTESERAVEAFDPVKATETYKKKEKQS